MPFEPRGVPNWSLNNSISMLFLQLLILWLLTSRSSWWYSDSPTRSRAVHNKCLHSGTGSSAQFRGNVSLLVRSVCIPCCGPYPDTYIPSCNGLFAHSSCNRGLSLARLDIRVCAVLCLMSFMLAVMASISTGFILEERRPSCCLRQERKGDILAQV